MLFDKDVLFELNENPLEGIKRVCSQTRFILELSESHEWSESDHDTLWESCSLINLAIENSQIDINFYLPEATSQIGENCVNLDQYLNSVEDYIKSKRILLNVEKYRTLYSAQFNKSFAYEFSPGDIHRIQELISELREQIIHFKDLDDSHRSRLLSRLEKLQSELNKRVSDLDRFWGLIGDAGVVLGKFGNDAKPLVDRIVEMSKIAWNTQARAEELPSDVPNPLIGNCN